MMPRRAFPVLFWVIAKSNMPPVKAKQQHKPSSPSKPASLRTIPLNTQTHGKSFHWTQQINPKGQTQKSKTTTKTPRDTHRNTHTNKKHTHTLPHKDTHAPQKPHRQPRVGASKAFGSEAPPPQTAGAGAAAPSRSAAAGPRCRGSSRAALGGGGIDRFPAVSGFDRESCFPLSWTYTMVGFVGEVFCYGEGGEPRSRRFILGNFFRYRGHRDAKEGNH